MTLPLTDERPVDETSYLQVEARERASDRLPALSGVRVFVVEDEADTRELLRAILTRCGAEVTVAPNGEAALEALGGTRFDVLVSDIAMSGGDGHDLIRKVRALDAERGGAGFPHSR